MCEKLQGPCDILPGIRRVNFPTKCLWYSMHRRGVCPGTLYSVSKQTLMTEDSMEQRELTLMFTDIVGYSRLMGRDQSQTIAMLEDYRRILVEQIEKHGGTVIEFIGDAVFARFDTPQTAVDAAVSIQKELFTFNHFRDKSLPRLQTRIGLNAGEVATKNGAVFGDDVNIAARLEPIAVADGICVSKTVYDSVKAELKEPVLSLGVQPLKNIESKVRAYLIRPLGITYKTRIYYLNRKLNQNLGAYRYPIAASFLLVIIAAFYFVPRWLVPGYDANYVEIAEFQNLMNQGGEADYLSSGITEALRSQLADVRDVYLVKADEGILAPIRLEGSVQKVGENLRIAYQLVRRKGNVQIAGGKLDGAYEDIFILQDRVVGEIAKYLANEFGLPNFRPARIDMTSDVLAYDYYMRGLDYLNRPSSEESMDEAIKFFTTALVHDDEFALANAGLCQAYWKKHQLTEIVDFIKKAESHCNFALQQDDALPKAAESMGIIYRETGRFSEAIEILESVVEKDKYNMQAVTALANVYGLANQAEQAEEILKNAIKIQPKNWEGYQGLGLLYLREGNIEKSIAAYNKVLELTPENSVALSNLSVGYFYLGNFEKAANALEKSVKLLPTSWGYSNGGTMFYFSRNFTRAAEMFEEALRLSPEDFFLYVNMADALRQLPGKESLAAKNYRKAISLASSNLQINNKDPLAYHVLATSYLRLGQFEEAAFNLRKAMNITPDEIEVLFTHLHLLCSQNRVAEAMDILIQLLDKGYSPAILRADPDLALIRGSVEFDELLAKYE